MPCRALVAKEQFAGPVTHIIGPVLSSLGLPESNAELAALCLSGGGIRSAAIALTAAEIWPFCLASARFRRLDGRNGRRFSTVTIRALQNHMMRTTSSRGQSGTNDESLALRWSCKLASS
jgi:hypothetical protein